MTMMQFAPLSTAGFTAPAALPIPGTLRAYDALAVVKARVNTSLGGV